MHSPALMRLAFLGVGVSMMMLALSGCGSGSAQQEEEAKPRPLPAEDGQPLPPGEYSSGEYKPTFSFEVGKGWSTLEMLPPDGFAIGKQGERWIGFTMFVEEVFKPGTQKVVEAPEDLVGWFQDHPYLKTSEPEPVTVGGIKGEWFDLVVEAPEDYYGQCGSADCMDMWMLSTGEALWFKEPFKTRLVVLEDVKGNTVVIDIDALPSEFDEFVPEAEKVVDTVKWGGS